MAKDTALKTDAITSQHERDRTQSAYQGAAGFGEGIMSGAAQMFQMQQQAAEAQRQQQMLDIRTNESKMHMATEHLQQQMYARKMEALYGEYGLRQQRAATQVAEAQAIQARQQIAGMKEERFRAGGLYGTPIKNSVTGQYEVTMIDESGHPRASEVDEAYVKRFQRDADLKKSQAERNRSGYRGGGSRGDAAEEGRHLDNLRKAEALRQQHRVDNKVEAPIQSADRSEATHGDNIDWVIKRLNNGGYSEIPGVEEFLKSASIYGVTGLRRIIAAAFSMVATMEGDNNVEYGTAIEVAAELWNSGDKPFRALVEKMRK